MPKVLLGAMALSAGLVAGVAAAQPAGSRSAAPRQCFRSHDYQAFRPIDEHAFNIRVGVSDYYRITLSGTCAELTYPGAFLITTVRGSDEICGPLDWDLKVGQSGAGGFAEPCIVESQTKLTAAEVAAMPKKVKP